MIDGGINDPEVRADWRGRGGLCGRHWRALPKGELAALLRGWLEQILADLEVFQRKYDYRHTHEPMGPEGDAWLRALGGEV